MTTAYVAGVGMTRFERPGRRDWDYPDMATEALRGALQDAHIAYETVEAAYVGYVYGDSTAGQRALYPTGMTGIPIYNVNNNCATGSTALQLAVEAVQTGRRDVVLALGFEKMQRGSLGVVFPDRALPVGRHVEAMTALYPSIRGPLAPQLYAAAAQELAERYGTTDKQLAAVAAKNHRHSVNNPNAQFQHDSTIDEVLASPTVCAPLTRLQCSPTSDGAAAAVVMSERAVRERGLTTSAVRVLAQAMTTDRPEALSSKSMVDIIGGGMAREAATRIYEESGLGPEDLDVIELHDCFTPNELVTYESLGLCAEGEAGVLAIEGGTTYGGQWVVNPSGGLISKGHPLGATGIAQCAEITWQLRGTAGKRQVSGARIGLTHNLGLGGACVVTLLQAPRADAAGSDLT